MEDVICSIKIEANNSWWW